MKNMGYQYFSQNKLVRQWKIHIQKNANKWTIYPAHYGVDEEAIFEWMKQQVLQSS